MPDLLPELTDPDYQQLALRLAEIGRNHAFVGETDPDDVRQSLIARSLAALPLIPDDRPLLDVGTGVGIPGVPLALVHPNRSTTYMEPRTACVSLLRWLVIPWPDHPRSIINTLLESADLSPEPAHSVVTRAALDWDPLHQQLPSTFGPIIRWSGPDVPMPPDRSDWMARRWTVQPPFLSQPQELIWWGPTELFHVKQSTWSAIDWMETTESK